jgi:hypothetical protein
MRIVRWSLGIVGFVVAAVLLLDTFGGLLFDGPLGPIPGGAFNGAVNPDPHPDWTAVEKVIELEIRPSKPWSLNIWAVAVDGELYALSKLGARRRWPVVALEDPRVRVRTHGQIYERRIVRVTDPVVQARVFRAFAERYGTTPIAPEQDPTWYFHLALRG